MKVNKRVLAAAVLATIGTVGAIDTALAITSGTYNLVISTTPTASATVSSFGTIYNTITSSYNVVTGISTSYTFGTGTGTWNSSFTFGGILPAASSQAMTDNATMVPSLAGNHGSGIASDGYAGILGITVTGTTFTVSNVAGMSGTISSAGVMTLDPTSRMGTVSDFLMLYDEKWNVNNCGIPSSTGCPGNGNTAYSGFTTGSATTYGSGGPATITGTGITSYASDQNGDSKTDYKGILVSGGQVGSAWGGFFGAGYLEVWRIRLLSTATPSAGFHVDTIYGTAGGNFGQYVPVPAAVWLFGSGLLGLVGIARRKKKA